MHARMSTFQAAKGLDDADVAQAVKQAEEQILPAAREMDGFRGIVYLAERETGRSISVTLWESEAALQASEEAADRLRDRSAQAAGEEIRGVERFEIAYLELDGKLVAKAGGGA